MSTGFGRNTLSLGATANTAKVSVATASSSTSLPLGGNRRYLLTTNTDCYVRYGTGAQTATTSAGGYTLFMPAGLAVVLMVAGDTIAAIRNSADGILSVSIVDSQ